MALISRSQPIILKYFLFLSFCCFFGCFVWFRYIVQKTESSRAVSLTALPQKLYTSDEIIYFTTGQGDAQNHEPRLLEYVRTHIVGPSGTRPTLADPTGSKDVSQIGQSKSIDKVLGSRRNGFFMECGAHDGEHLSNSLFFELERNWTGLLIEADPTVHTQLLKKNRNAYFLPACLSASLTPSVVKFRVASVLGGIASQQGDWQKNAPVMLIPCYPFNTILEAIGVRHIDYFSLDVELAELAILNTINFERVQIDVISLEYSRSSPELSAKQLADYLNFFNQTAVKYGRRYEVAFYLPEGRTSANGQDVVFKLIP